MSRRIRKRIRGPIAGAAMFACIAALIAAAPTAAALPVGSTGAASTDTTSTPAAIPEAQRNAVLGQQWRTSDDLAWTSSGDSSGFHILTAHQNDGYTWKTIATLSEPGIETSRWIGNACVTGSGDFAVVAYGPAELTNSQQLSDRGAFTAVVDLRTGQVSKLPVNASMAYFDPGCGTGDDAVITQSDNDGSTPQTRLQTVDAAHAKVTSTVTVTGQITSAVPSSGAIVAASGRQLVRISSKGTSTTLAKTRGVPFHLHADQSGTAAGVTFLDTDGTSETVDHQAGVSTSILARASLGQLGLSSGASGHVYITGGARPLGHLPSSVSTMAVAAGTQTSLHGGLAVTDAAAKSLTTPSAQQGTSGAPQTSIAQNTLRSPGVGTAPKATAASPAVAAQPILINAIATHAHSKVSFTVSPTVSASAKAAATGAAPSPLLPYETGGADAVSKAKAHRSLSPAKVSLAAVTPNDSPTDPVDEDHTCSVARNDPSTMVYQPTPNQVEWAADLAVRGLLTSANISRPASWKDSSLPAWSPQSMFPMPALAGGGQMPPQVLLGILTQESNLWQASSHAEPGEYGNPLVGNFYGTNVYPGTTGYDPNLIWNINWSNADCGYGIGQVTDGMRLAGHEKPGETALPATEQRALAMDYATNIAYSAQILATKWNELHAVTPAIKINNDDASKPENWFAAIWDYNEGFNAPGTGSTYGLGWYNNPANPIYPADRGPFLDGNIHCTVSNVAKSGYAACATNTALTDGPTYVDAANPQNWPYEEKVLGWGAAPIDTGHSYDDNGVKNNGNTAGYSAAWWNSDYDRVNLKPPLNTFCNTNNACDVTNPPACETQHLQNCDANYWYSHPATWKTDCATSCGNAYMTYKTLRAEPGDAHPAAINCGPVGSTIIGSISASVPEAACPSGGQQWTDGGTFSFSFPADANGNYEAKEDLQQISSGYGGHYWFSHGRQDGNWGNLLETTGTWTPKNLPSGTYSASDIPSHMYQIQVHMPYLGNKTKSAQYVIFDGAGHSYTQTVDQSSVTNGWIIMGTYALGPGAKVVLTNITDDSTSGDTTVAYDAMMFYPIAGPPPTTVTFPAGNANATPMDYSGGGTPEYMSNLKTVGLTYPSNVGNSKAAASATAKSPQAPLPCSEVKRKTGFYHCISSTTKPLNSRSNISAADTSVPPDFPTWCEKDPTFTRFESCEEGTLSYQFNDSQTGAVVGNASFSVKQETILNANSATFDDYMSITPINIDTQLMGIEVNVTSACQGSCTDGATTWYGAQEWATGDVHVATAHTSHTWMGSANWNDLQLNWTAPVVAGASGLGVAYPAWSTTDEPNGEIRCDKVVAGNSGCVFDKYIPGFTVDTDIDPAAAAFYWVLEQQLSTHPGSRVQNKPLHRLGDLDEQAANRNKICDSSFKKRWGVAAQSCDEYPFASSEESGGQLGITSGLSCAQLAAMPVPSSISPNAWELSWDEAYPFPTTSPWNLVCGRANMPGDQNSGVGGDLGRFTTDQRIMPANLTASPVVHGDAYFVDVPGFDSCTGNNESSCTIAALP